MTPLRQRMIEDMKLRNLSPRTIEAYVMRAAGFARHFGRSPAALGREEVRSYLLHLVQEKKVSWSVYNQTVAALKFLYEVTLNREGMMVRVRCPKQPKTLPTVLSLDETARKPPTGGPDQVLKYLARYTHRVAISNQRLIALEDGKVRFRWKDYAHGRAPKTMALNPVEFIRRFLLHVLPSGFVRIRHYGFPVTQKQATTDRVHAYIQPDSSSAPILCSGPGTR